MKKVLWWLLILVAIGSIGYFIAYPFLSRYLTENHPEILAKVGIKVEEKKEDESKLSSFNEEAQIDVKEGWSAPVQFVYVRRDIPSIEKDFYSLGYPQFLYVTDASGGLNQNVEKSFREDGALIYLYMDSTYYLDKASIEYAVSRDKFNSVSMNEHIGVYLDFIHVITNKEVSEDDKNALLRVFTNVFNDKETKNNKVKINDLEFSISLDTFYRLIIMEC